MYYSVFRWFPKSAFSRLMGALASRRWPRWVLLPLIRLYIRVYRIDMTAFDEPAGGFPTFNAFFTRPVKPGARPIEADARRVVSPVDGSVIEGGAVSGGRLLQAKGRSYSLSDLLNGDPVWREYDGGSFLTLYLSPRDYHRIHSPCAGRVVRFCYVPGELWTVSPAGVRSVPGLFPRNERLITVLETDFGEVLLVAVGATVVGKIKVVYHAVTSNLRGAVPLAEALQEPYAVKKGEELGRFELGSTVILLFRPGAVELDGLASGAPVRMGEGIATLRAGGAG
jgi:phosphatidylserine decarboxylase